MRFEALHATVHAHVPRTTAPFVELEVVALTPLRASPGEPPAHALGALLDWCVRHTTRVEYPDGYIERDVDDDTLDECLMPAELVRYALAIRDAASLAPQVIEEVREHFARSEGGTCTCRVCEGRAAHEDRAMYGCLYANTPDHVWHILGAWWPVHSEPVLDRPYPFYQIKQAWMSSRGRTHTKREAAQKRKQKIREKMKQRGLIP